MADPYYGDLYLYVPYTQTVTYTPRNNEGVYLTPVTVNYVLVDIPGRMPLQEGPMDLLYKTAYFTLWIENLQGIVPAQGDKITDENSNIWLVHSVNVDDVKKLFKYCVKCYDKDFK